MKSYDRKNFFYFSNQNVLWSMSLIYGLKKAQRYIIYCDGNIYFLSSRANTHCDTDDIECSDEAA